MTQYGTFTGGFGWVPVQLRVRLIDVKLGLIEPLIWKLPSTVGCLVRAGPAGLMEMTALSMSADWGWGWAGTGDAPSRSAAAAAVSPSRTRLIRLLGGP